MSDVAALAELEDLQAVLSSGGYDCRIGSLGQFSRVLLAENPYALVATVETDSWNHLVQLVSDVQAELTHLALASDRASIRWDLYLLVHVRKVGLQPIESVLMDRVEADIKYARKFVRVNLIRSAQALDQALRPFLPLRESAVLEMADPFELLRAELGEQEVNNDLVEHALRHFKRTGEVTVP